jgi:opacity protein-like surface antigen
MRAFLFAVASVALLASTAQAQSDKGVYGIYGSLGTEGLGLGLPFLGNPGWNLRAEINSLNIDRNKRIDDADYQIDVKHLSQSVLLDYRPFQGGFRLTTGVGINQSKLDFNGVASQTSFGVTQTGTVKGRVELQPTMPYVGLGWGLGKSKSGIGFYADLGAYVGSPKLKSFETTGPINAETERRNLEDELRSIKVYPVGKIGISYQF